MAEPGNHVVSTQGNNKSIREVVPIYTRGSGDLEGGGHAALDRIRLDLHAAHLHRVVLALICKLADSHEIFTSPN